MTLEDTWHWILAVFLLAEIVFWLGKKIGRFMTNRLNLWAKALDDATKLKAVGDRTAEQRKQWLNDYGVGVIQVETSAKIPARPFIEPKPKPEPVEKKDPVFRPGIWMQK